MSRFVIIRFRQGTSLGIGTALSAGTEIVEVNLKIGVSNRFPAAPGSKVMRKCPPLWKACAAALLLAGVWSSSAIESPPAAPLQPVVELEEEVYTYEPANNGAGPMWCSGSTCSQGFVGSW